MIVHTLLDRESDVSTFSTDRRNDRRIDLADITQGIERIILKHDAPIFEHMELRHIVGRCPIKSYWICKGSVLTLSLGARCTSMSARE